MENTTRQVFDFGDGRGTTPEYRSWYRGANPPRWYSGWGHFLFTSLVTVAGVVYCLTRTHQITHLEWLTVPATLLYANLAEYLGHRGPMHVRLRFLETIFLHTTIHHRFFTHDKFGWEQSRDFHALLLPPYILAFFFGLFALPVGILLGIYVSPNVAYLFVASAVGYFISYEWLHFCYHSPEGSLISRLPIIAQLRRHHLIHHNPQLMTRYNFNITVPLFDRVFGTQFTSDRKLVPELAVVGVGHSIGWPRTFLLGDYKHFFSSKKPRPGVALPEKSAAPVSPLEPGPAK